MNSEKIEGVGSVYGGKYESINIEGIGKLKGDTDVKKITVEGLLKGKGKITTDEISIEGIARVFRNIKAERVAIDGILKLRRASLYADKITCDGIITCNREVSADNIYIDGVCSVHKMYGDKIFIRNKENGIAESRIPARLVPFLKLYFGREVSLNFSLIDIIECTDLEAAGIKSKTIRANSVKLADNCIVEKLYCDGEIIIDDTCRIGQIISKSKPTMNKKEMGDMADPSFVKILDLYKAGKITADEAEKMIGIKDISKPNSEPEVPWEDDGKLRIVAYIGRKLIRKGSAGAQNINIEYAGDVLNVESYGSLSCGNVQKNANAGGSITCGDVGGNISCGGSVICKNASGNIAAGGGVRIQR